MGRSASHLSRVWSLLYRKPDPTDEQIAKVRELRATGAGVSRIYRALGGRVSAAMIRSVIEEAS